MLNRKYFFTFLPFLFGLIYIGWQFPIETNKNTLKTASQTPINGISIEAPPKQVSDKWTTDIKKLNANWAAIIPYAFTPKNSFTVKYGEKNQYQWWGEKLEGTKEMIAHAQSKKLKVMLKPQVWVSSGWPGSFTCATEQQWKIWEDSYRNYILLMARTAQELNVQLLCIGTEYDLTAIQRPKYWASLIKQIRAIYRGPITYAANWDKFEKIPFWSQLDYMGIDAYFPLSKETNPEVNHLIDTWKPIKERLKLLAYETRKPLIFTEYGYQSTDQCTWNNWEKEKQPKSPVNLTTQENAYKALYISFWDEPWFKGGFLWKWHCSQEAGGINNNDYTPQNKPVELVIKKWYKNR